MEICLGWARDYPQGTIILLGIATKGVLRKYSDYAVTCHRSLPVAHYSLPSGRNEGIATYCSDRMEKLIKAIDAGDSDGVKIIVRDENLIHRINELYNGHAPLHHACS